MSYFDDIDKQLENTKYIQESLKSYKSQKLKNIRNLSQTNKSNTYITFNKKKIRIKSKKKKFKSTPSVKRKIRIKQSIRQYKRCPRVYNIYIETEWWYKRKNKYYQTHPRICSACNSTENIKLHHMLYANYGSEFDEHLMPLCHRCHEELHTTYGVKKNLILETNLFVESKKSIHCATV